MPKWSRQGQKQPPQVREPEKIKKKTLQEHCRDLTASFAEARRTKLQEEKRERDREAEDELMVLLYGPDWRKKAPSLDEPEEQKKAS